MSGRPSVKRVKYQNVGFVLAALLLFILSVTSSCTNKRLTADVQSSSSSSSSAIQGKNNGVFSKNYKYQSMDNSALVGQGNLVLVNKDHQFTSKNVSLDSVYSYLFNSAGTQIMSTSSTSLYATKEMFTQLNKLVSAFYDKTKLATIMISNSLYKSADESSSAPSDSSETDSTAVSGVSANGCYEHETGLAVDLQLYNSTEGTYPEFDGKGDYSWINENCWKYGFVLRYPEGKEDITGVKAMANHYRYVGVPFAEIMHNNDLTLEEFMDYIKAYSFEKPLEITAVDTKDYAVYYVSADKGKTTNIPLPMTEGNTDYKYIISGDNEGGYIVSIDLTSGDDTKKTDDTSKTSEKTVDSSSQADIA